MSEKSNVICLSVGDKIHPDGILEAARNAHLGKVIVIGWTESGDFYVAGSETIEQTIFLMRNAEYELFSGMGGDE